jgi:hypothetical protein
MPSTPLSHPCSLAAARHARAGAIAEDSETNSKQHRFQQHSADVKRPNVQAGGLSAISAYTPTAPTRMAVTMIFITVQSLSSNWLSIVWYFAATCKPPFLQQKAEHDPRDQTKDELAPAIQTSLLSPLL